MVVGLLMGSCSVDAESPGDGGTDAPAQDTNPWGPPPTCEPRPEAPACEGDGCVLAPRCPPGWAPQCGHIGTWGYTEDTGCISSGYPPYCDTRGAASCPVKVEVRCNPPRDVSYGSRTVHCESPDGWALPYVP